MNLHIYTYMYVHNLTCFYMYIGNRNYNAPRGSFANEINAPRYLCINIRIFISIHVHVYSDYLCMFIYIYIYKYVYIYIYMLIYIEVYINIYMYVYVYTNYYNRGSFANDNMFVQRASFASRDFSEKQRGSFVTGNSPNNSQNRGIHMCIYMHIYVWIYIC
jgi:hypothetical protein